MSIMTEIIKGKCGKFGVITLNRPQALNALNLEMIKQLDAQLQAWEKDSEIHAVIIQSDHPKAFCAGGDIREIYEAQITNDPMRFEFFEREYALNAYIGAYSKPYISFLNGITMGGGVGISLHGSHRIAGENFQFAMPETAIGLFPDVGGSFLLNQCEEGLYLGLTGTRLSQREAFDLSFVDVCIASSKHQALKEALFALDLQQEAHVKISSLLDAYHEVAPTVWIAPDWRLEAFAKNSIEEILTSLRDFAQKMPDAQKLLENLEKKCPLSLKITFELLKHKVPGKNLKTCLDFDKTLAFNFLNNENFAEGIRALIVDKDLNPRWNPATLSEVSELMVSEFFK